MATVWEPVVLATDDEQEAYFEQAGKRYEDNEIPMEAFIAEHRITMAYQWTECENPWCETTTSWTVTLYRPDPTARGGRRTFTTAWSRGNPAPPTTHEVLGSIKTECEWIDDPSIDCGARLQDEMGAWDDLREANRVYSSLVKCRKQMIKFLGQDEYDVLIDRVERD